MRKNISTIDSGSSAVEASMVMSTDKVGYIIVLEKRRPVGMLTERDLVLKVMAEGKSPAKTKVAECMSSPLVMIDPDKSVEEAVETMKKHGFRRLLVVKDNIIYGIFTASDLIEHFEDFEEKLINELVRFVPW